MRKQNLPHLEDFGKPGTALCGARVDDPLGFYEPGRDSEQTDVCKACAAYVPRAGARGRLIDLVTGTGRYKR